MRVPFIKMHGLGNDFVVVDGLRGPDALVRLTAPDVAVRLCDRNTGIGADGVLLVLPSDDAKADARMRVINADGSEPEMCGNGVRCVVRYLHDRDPGGTRTQPWRIETIAGVRDCTVSGDSADFAVRVDMGAPNFDRASLPMTGAGEAVDHAIAVADQPLAITAVSMGNPHAVAFFAEGVDLASTARNLGPLVECHPDFPQRTNAEFCRITAAGATTWVWERGCGITDACGTGACAVAVAAVRTDRHDPSQTLPVHLPGGTLHIDVAEDLTRVWMEGPAVEVYRGDVTVSLEAPTRER